MSDVLTAVRAVRAPAASGRGMQETGNQVGLVCTGGNLRGVCAETGALIALEEAGARFDVVIGASAGSIVGALYASGMAPREIAAALRTLRRKDYLDADWRGLVLAVPRLFTGWHGVYKGQALLRWLKQHLPEHNRIEKTERKLYLCVTNTSRQEAQVKQQGPLAEFVRGSAALPLVFKMQRVEGEWYSDGGILNNVPVDELVEHAPEVGRLAIVTALRVEEKERGPSEQFLRKTFTPLHMIGRYLKAVEVEIKRTNRDPEGRDVVLVRARVPRIELDEPQRIDEAIQAAYEDVCRRLDKGELKIDALFSEEGERAAQASGGSSASSSAASPLATSSATLPPTTAV